MAAVWTACAASPKAITCKFDSMGDVLSYIENTPSTEPNEKNVSERIERNNDWTGTSSRAEAIALARDGWPEGRAMMADALRLAVAATSPRPSKAPFHDVAGEQPDIGRYLAGDPACMIRQAPATSRRRPVVRIVASIFASSIVDADIIMKRGAAILAQIDAWEAAGWSIELDTVLDGKGFEIGAGDKCTIPNLSGRYKIAAFTNIKRPSDPLDIDRAAFALVHPSMFRRVGFAVLERLNASAAARSCYCYPFSLAAEAPSLLEDHTSAGPMIYMEPLGMGTESNYATPERAAAYLSPMFERAIFKHD